MQPGLGAARPEPRAGIPGAHKAVVPCAACPALEPGAPSREGGTA